MREGWIMKAKLLQSIVLAVAIAAAPAMIHAQEAGKAVVKPTPAKPQVRSSGGSARIHSQSHVRSPQGQIRSQSQTRINRSNVARSYKVDRSRNIQVNRQRNIVSKQTFHSQKNINWSVAKQRKIDRTLVKKQNFQQRIVQQNNQKFRFGESSERARAVKLSSDQRLRIRNLVHRHHLHRVARASFPIFVGGYVPRSYAIYDMPEYFVEDVPEYEGYKYVLIGDQLLIIDPETLEIVAIIQV